MHSHIFINSKKIFFTEKEIYGLEKEIRLLVKDDPLQFDQLIHSSLICHTKYCELIQLSFK